MHWRFEKRMKIDLCKDAKSPDFDAVYADMLMQFPASELKDKVSFGKLISRSDYDLGIVRDSDCGIVSYFACYIAESEGIGLLDYFAVSSKMHSKGIGGRVLESIRNRYSGLKGLILEVEKPDGENPDTLRRIKFYERCGAYILDMDYLLPAPGGSVQPMELMFLNCGDFRGRISLCEVARALRPVFENVHSSCFSHSMKVYQRLIGLWGAQK